MSTQATLAHEGIDTPTDTQTADANANANAPTREAIVTIAAQTTGTVGALPDFEPTFSTAVDCVADTIERVIAEAI